MTTKFSLCLLFALLSGCGILDKNDSPDAAPIVDACAERKFQLEASIEKLNHCESASDCTETSVHPHWGCVIYVNKTENTVEVKAAIDSYSMSSCWDGRTTLTMLDCSLSETDFSCVNKKCE